VNIDARGARRDSADDRDTPLRTLIGSKFGAAVAEGQEANWLIGSCTALAGTPVDLAEASSQSVKAALQLRRSANERHNQLAHGAKTVSSQADDSVSEPHNVAGQSTKPCCTVLPEPCGGALIGVIVGRPLSVGLDLSRGSISSQHYSHCQSEASSED
jgi:hypothetical protein